jgi:hypothetical protein
MREPSRIYELRDKRWYAIAKPLLEFLETSRNWVVLEAWSKEVKFGGDFLRNALAWASHKHLIRYDELGWKVTAKYKRSDFADKDLEIKNAEAEECDADADADAVPRRGRGRRKRYGGGS